MNYIYIKHWGIPIGAFDETDIKMGKDKENEVFSKRHLILVEFRVISRYFCRKWCAVS